MSFKFLNLRTNRRVCESLLTVTRECNSNCVSRPATATWRGSWERAISGRADSRTANAFHDGFIQFTPPAQRERPCVHPVRSINTLTARLKHAKVRYYHGLRLRILGKPCTNIDSTTQLFAASPRTPAPAAHEQKVAADGFESNVLLYHPPEGEAW